MSKQNEDKLIEDVLISQDVDSSYQFFKGIGWKQVKYFLFTLPIYPMIIYFPLFHHPIYAVDLTTRAILCVTVFFLILLVLQFHTIKGADITNIEMLFERIAFRIRKKEGKTEVFYDKFREEQSLKRKFLKKKQSTSQPLPSTQEYVLADDVTPYFLVLKEEKKLIGGIHLPDINSILLSDYERVELREQFALCLTEAGVESGNIQIKRESIPTDLSDLILSEEKKIKNLTTGISKKLQNDYINYLLSKADASVNEERKTFLLISESFKNSNDFSDTSDILLEKLTNLQDSLMDLLEDGYETNLSSSSDLAYLIEISTNNEQARRNRYFSKSPEIILYDQEGDSTVK